MGAPSKSRTRVGSRYSLKIPIRIRLVDPAGEISEEITEVIDVSATGAYFFTALPLELNQEISVSLPLARKMRLLPTGDPVFKCQARVVRLETHVPDHPGKRGAAIRFLVYRRR